MNELGRDRAPRYISTKLDRDMRRIAPRIALTDLISQIII